MPKHAIRLVRIGVVSSWAVFSMHHAYEAGLAHSNGPIGIVVISTVILLATLALLERYERTGSQSVYALFSVLTLLWWVGVNGLVEGFYGHTLKDLLYFLVRVAPAALPRTPLGLTYDVPTNLFGEVTGVLPFVFAILVAVAWFRLEVSGARRRLHGVDSRRMQEADGSPVQPGVKRRGQGSQPGNRYDRSVIAFPIIGVQATCAVSRTMRSPLQSART